MRQTSNINASFDAQLKAKPVNQFKDGVQKPLHKCIQQSIQAGKLNIPDRQIK